MPQSLVKNYIHLIFSTKNREDFIQPKFEQELHAYLGVICNKLECQIISAGGFIDHVHLLFLLSQKIPLMEIVQKVKANSSKWMKTRSPELENFFWQEGYGAFSVSHKNVEGIKFVFLEVEKVVFLIFINIIYLINNELLIWHSN